MSPDASSKFQYASWTVQEHPKTVQHIATQKNVRLADS